MRVDVILTGLLILANKANYFEACLAVWSEEMHFALHKAVLIIAFLVEKRVSVEWALCRRSSLISGPGVACSELLTSTAMMKACVEPCLRPFPFQLFPYFIPTAGLARGASNNLTFFLVTAIATAFRESTEQNQRYL